MEIETKHVRDSRMICAVVKGCALHPAAPPDLKLKFLTLAVEFSTLDGKPLFDLTGVPPATPDMIKYFFENLKRPT